MSSQIVKHLLTQNKPPDVVLRQVLDMLVGCFGDGEVMRIKNVGLAVQIFTDLYPVLDDQYKILVLSSMGRIIRYSPYNGKLLSSNRSLNLPRGLLGLLAQATERPVFDNLLHIIYLLNVHHTSPAQVKAFFKILSRVAQKEDPLLPNSRFYSMLKYFLKGVNMQYSSHNAYKVGGKSGTIRPRSFFDFDGLNQKTGIRLPQFMFDTTSYAFSSWFRAESFLDPANRTAYRPRLLSFSTDNGASIEMFFVAMKGYDKSKLIVEILPKRGKSTYHTVLDFVFDSQRWYHIAVNHSGPRIKFLSSPQLDLYVDGAAVCNSALKFPNIVAPMTQSYIGTNYEDISTSFFGQMANMQYFNNTLTVADIQGLYRNNPSSSTLPSTVGKNLLFAYSPEAACGEELFDVSLELADRSGFSKGSTLYNATLFPGTTALITKTIIDSFNNIGGFELIFSAMQMMLEYSAIIKDKAYLDTNEEAGMQVGKFFSLILDILSATLKVNRVLRDDMEQKNGFSCLRVLMKRCAPYVFVPSITDGIRHLIVVLQRKKLLESMCKDFLFDFSLWAVASYDFALDYIIFLRKEIVTNTAFYQTTIGVPYLLDIIKGFYWVTDKPDTLENLATKVQKILPKGGQLPFRHYSRIEILNLRRNILNMVQAMMIHDAQASDTSTLLSFLLNPPDLYQEDIICSVLQLLHRCEYATKMVAHMEAENALFLFLHLLSHGNETIRSFSIRILSLLLFYSSKKLFKSVSEDAVFNFMREQLEIHTSTMTCKTFIALYESSIGIISESVFAENEIPSEMGFDNPIKDRRFLRILLILSETCPIPIRKLVFSNILLPLMKKKGHIKIINTLDFPRWLADMTVVALGESKSLLQSCGLMYLLLFRFCTVRRAGHTIIEQCASYALTLRDPNMFLSFFYERLRNSCSTIFQSLSSYPSERQYTIITNMCYLFILFEQYLFYSPKDLFSDASYNLRRNAQSHWLDIHFALAIIEFTEIFFGVPFFKEIRTEMLAQNSRDIDTILLHLILVALRESDAILFIPQSEKAIQARMVAQKKRSSGTLAPLLAGTAIGGFSVVAEAAQPKIPLHSPEGQYNTFLVSVSDKLRSLSYYLLESENAANCLLWEAKEVEKTIKKLRRTNRTLPPELFRWYQELLIHYGKEMSAKLSHSSIPPLSHPHTLESNFLIFFQTLQEIPHLAADIEKVREREEARQRQITLEWLSIVQQQQTESATLKKKQSIYVHSQAEDVVSDLVGQYRSTKIDTAHASWLYHEEEHQAIAEGITAEWERTIMLRNENFPFFKEDLPIYWKVDSTEDSLRRRWKERRNYKGSSYTEFSLSYIRHQEEKKENLTHQSSTPINPDIYTSLRSSGSIVGEEEGEEEEGDHDGMSNSVNEEEWCMLDTKDFKDEETLLSISCELISMQNVYPGSLDITKKTIYFSSDKGTSGKMKNKRWELSNVKGIHKRRYLLRNTALELFLSNHKSFLFDFTSHEREKVHSLLISVSTNLEYYSKEKTPRQTLRRSDITLAWQQRHISNFEYIMQLNTIAGRTYNDLSQYPIAPWILTDYTSPTIDLNDPSIYRDLSKPIGALNEKRFADFKARYDMMPDDDPTMPKFLYGSHYSTALVVLYYLIRMEPFTKQYLQLQGRFDHADRIFDSVATAWKNSFSLSQDVKELIPEFFYNASFFYNQNNLDLGVRQASDTPIHHVEMPPWAATPEDFVRIHREALESDYVSEHLHEWVDLIFGYKQRGKHCHRSHNVFFHLTYEGAVNIDAIEDPVLRSSTIEQIISFGQTPAQLFVKAHPKRNAKPASSLQSIFESPARFNILERVETKLIPLHVFATENSVFMVNSRGLAVSFSYTHWQGKSFRMNPNQHYAPGLPICPLNIPRLASHCMLVVPASKIIVSFGFWDHTLRCSQLRSPYSLLSMFVGHTGRVTVAALSESNRFVVSGAEDNVLMLWDLRSMNTKTKLCVRKPRNILRGHESPIRAVAICQDLDLIVSASDDKVLLHTIYSASFIRRVELPPKHAVDLVKIVPATGRLITYSSAANELACYDVNGKRLYFTLVKGIRKLLVTADGAHCIGVGVKIHFWKVHSSFDLITNVEIKIPILCACLSPDESLLFVVGLPMVPKTSTLMVFPILTQ